MLTKVKSVSDSVPCSMTCNTYKKVTAAVWPSFSADCSNEEFRSTPTFIQAGSSDISAVSVTSDEKTASAGNAAVWERYFVCVISEDPLLADVKVGSSIYAGDYTSTVFEFNAGMVHYQLQLAPIR